MELQGKFLKELTSKLKCEPVEVSPKGRYIKVSSK